jgi:hypothetical protein
MPKTSGGFCLLPTGTAGTLTRTSSYLDVTKDVKVKLFAIFFACTWKDPDSSVLNADPENGRLK